MSEMELHVDEIMVQVFEIFVQKVFDT